MADDFFNWSFNRKVKQSISRHTKLQKLDFQLNNEFRLLVNKDFVESLKGIIDSQGNEKQKKLYGDFCEKYNLGELTGKEIDIFKTMNELYGEQTPERIAKLQQQQKDIGG